MTFEFITLGGGQTYAPTQVRGRAGRELVVEAGHLWSTTYTQSSHACEGSQPAGDLHYMVSVHMGRNRGSGSYIRHGAPIDILPAVAVLRARDVRPTTAFLRLADRGAALSVVLSLKVDLLSW